MRRFLHFLIGAPPEGELPARVREDVARQQNDSEILIGWVLLFLVSVLGVLYGVAPKAFDESAPFEPVPVVIATLGALAAVRLLLAYLGALPRLLLALSVIAEVGLLIGLIWSFHIQYGQPPGFYLKAPTMLYLFGILALRALRFEAAYVLLAGVIAAAGWAWLVWYAVSGMAIGDPVTRDFVEYMTSYRVLLGAEFDKILAILMVTGVLALAIVRANRLLVRAAAQGHAARDLSRFFAPEVVTRITGAEDRIAVGEGEVREAAILLVDIRGFSTLAAEWPPARTMRVLAEYEARMVPLIRGHGGVVDKFMGDGILATFGAARISETPAADAVSAAVAVADAAAFWGRERREAGEPVLEIGVGVASGPVVFGAVGHDERLEYTVIGAAVNLAAKLEKHNKVLHTRALTDAATLALARAQGWTGQPLRTVAGARVDGLDRAADLAVLA